MSHRTPVQVRTGSSVSPVHVLRGPQLIAEAHGRGMPDCGAALRRADGWFPLAAGRRVEVWLFIGAVGAPGTAASSGRRGGVSEAKEANQI